MTDVRLPETPNYSRLDVLGSGATGRVHLAIDKRNYRKVALKTASSDEDARSILNEAATLARLSHPAIIEFHDADSEGCYLATTYHEGETLRERLNRGPLPLHEALRIATSILQGLDHAHDCGIMHRDIKPENLFLTAAGQGKLIDFGSSKPVQKSDIQDSDGLNFRGTGPYTAPEVFRGQPHTPQSDLFSLGAVLFEMAAGRPAFSGNKPADIAMDVLNHNPDMEAVPAALTIVLNHALAKLPRERYASAKAFLLDLATAGHAAPAPEYPEDFQAAFDPRRIRRQKLQRLGVFTAMGVSVALTIGALLAAVRREQRHRRAQEFVHQAQAFGTTWTPSTAALALERYDQAIALEPRNPQPHIGKAILYAMMSDAIKPTREVLPAMLEEADLAVKTGPKEPMAYAARGVARALWERDYLGAQEDAAMATMLGPQVPEAHYWRAYLLTITGQKSEAIRESTLAVALAPSDPIAAYVRAQTFIFFGEPKAGLKEAQRMLKNTPSAWYMRCYAAMVLTDMGRCPEALQEINRQGDVTSPAWLSFRGYVLAKCGRQDDARRILGVLHDLDESGSALVTQYHFALIDIALGKDDQALGHLRKSAENHDEIMAFAAVNPWLASLRSRPEFLEILQIVKQPARPQ